MTSPTSIARRYLFLFVLAAANVCQATDVVKVEETWELTVGDPNVERNAPQVTMVMSPSRTARGRYFALTLNFRSQPSYEPGGLQLAVFDNESPVSFANAPIVDSLSAGADTVRWTQRMEVQDGTVTFDVVDGSSESWGAFGGSGWLRQTIHTGRGNLNHYRPSVSLAESEIGYAGNRVASLTLVRIRWYTSNGQVYEANAPFDIDSDLDPFSNDADFGDSEEGTD
jgi:hypothetical protein